MARRVYSLLLFLLLPLVLLRLLWRARQQPAYLRNIRERFGRYTTMAPAPTIWVHAVSVGETRAAAPLIQALRQRYPTHRILLTHTTPTGRAISEELFGNDVARVYLPFDLPFAVQRFLRHFHPALGIVMETELWPNLLHAARRENVPLALVNARMSARSATRYARWPSLSRPTLHALSFIGAQTQTDAQRLESLGAAAVEITGNMKFDFDAPTRTQPPFRVEAESFTPPNILLSSTRDGEERVILDAVYEDLKDLARLVIVPRHPQRFDEVANLLAQRGIAYQRRSANEPIRPSTRVVLGDSMGEMFAYYAACDIAFVGGSLVPTGGQNLLEACAMGKPVLIGPHTFNFDEATRLAIEAGAALRVADGAELARAARQLLADAQARARMGEAGLAFVRAHRGATARTMAQLEKLLPPR